MTGGRLPSQGPVQGSHHLLAMQHDDRTSRQHPWPPRREFMHRIHNAKRGGHQEAEAEESPLSLAIARNGEGKDERDVQH